MPGARKDEAARDPKVTDQVDLREVHEPTPDGGQVHPSGRVSKAAVLMIAISPVAPKDVATSAAISMARHRGADMQARNVGARNANASQVLAITGAPNETVTRAAPMGNALSAIDLPVLPVGTKWNANGSPAHPTVVALMAHGPHVLHAPHSIRV